MEEISVLTRSRKASDRRKNSYQDHNDVNKPATLRNQEIDDLAGEERESFCNYLNWQGLDQDPNLLILPSKNHYFYDVEELKGVTTLINLRKLNLMKRPGSFLNSIYGLLSPKANFIGCFTDRKSFRDENVPSRIYKRFINFLDNRAEVNIDRKDVLRLLESNGFRVVDMTEINGMTYFNTRKNGYTSANNHDQGIF